MAKNLYGKKKAMRNLLIGVITAIVIAAAIFLAVALQKDGAGMNCFQRNATAASADGVKATVVEYRTMYDMIFSQYGSLIQSEDQIRNIQEYCAREVLMQKVYEKEAKALGLSLTEEQVEACRKVADNQITSYEQYFTSYLVQNGNYSKTAMDKQLENFYTSLGMSENAYRAFLTQNAAAEYYHQAILNYYKENGSGIDEDALVDYYRKSVEESMTVKNEDGTETTAYINGQFWDYLQSYTKGAYSPMLYVPEGFIYIDYIEIRKGTTEEVEEVIRKFNDGEITFDELMNSEENQDAFKDKLTAPYPIAENDHGQLFTPQEVYTKAAALKTGEIDSFIAQAVTDEDGNTTVTGYLFRRAEGNMCYEGDHGVIKIDYFDGIRGSAEEQYWLEQWLSDLKFEDAIYAYKGAGK